MRYAGELWWEQIPSAAQAVREISEALLGAGTVWISGDIPWRQTLREMVKERLEVENSALSLNFLDGEELAGVQEADLFSEYDAGALRSYLPPKNLYDYIRERRVLPNTVLWICGLDGAEGERWLAASAALARARAELRIVCEGALCKNANRKNVLAVDMDDRFSEFDALLFAMTRPMSGLWPSELKLYAARLAVELAGGGAERVELLLSDGDALVDDPLGAYGKQDGAERSVRSAQVKSLYPKIELERERLITPLRDRILRLNLVPYQDEYGNSIDAPEDLELRHLVFMEKYRGLPLSEEEARLLHLLHGARNAIAHRKIVPPETVRFILRL